MTLNLIKLAVGIEDVAQLKERQARLRRPDGTFAHRTRMTPKRIDELLDGGSMYWVIKRYVQVRQPILAFHQETDKNGKTFCLIELAPEHITVEPQRRRPFQGWRYLRPEDAPADFGTTEGHIDPDMPTEMRAELKRIGLI